MSLLDTTQTLLKDTLAAGVGLSEIARGSEGRVDYEWLKKLAQGRIDDPGVTRIEALHGRLNEPDLVEKRQQPVN